MFCLAISYSPIDTKYLEHKVLMPKILVEKSLVPRKSLISDELFQFWVTMGVAFIELELLELLEIERHIWSK